MGEFNPERYLRLLGERLVVRDHRGVVRRRAEDLFEAATALVTCGVIDGDLAWRVLDDYTAAFGMSPFRDPPGSRTGTETGNPALRATPLTPRRVHLTGMEIESRHGLGRLYLRWIVLTGSRVTIALKATVPSPFALRGATPTVLVTLPDGQQIEAVFSGPVEPWLSGDFEGEAAVDPDVRWLLIDGTRVDLEPSPVGVDVTIEERARADPAIALIWQLLADFSDPRGWPDTGAPALEALRAAGVISNDDPQLAAISWARRHAPPAERSGWTPEPPAAWTTPPETVPAEWRSLARSRRVTITGPTRTLAVGAVTPMFDGFCIAVDLVQSHASGLSLEVEISGLNPSHRWAELHRRPLAFWARDDRGNHYLGRRFGWSRQSPDSTGGHGSVVFNPLDSEATRLTVMATTAAARASIEIPL